MIYSQYVNNKELSQSEPITGSNQVKNSCGGFAFAVDDWTRLERFLILGSENGSFYVGEKELTKDNAAVVIRCIQADGMRAVSTIVSISKEGRAPKNTPALFALALAASCENKHTKQLAIQALPEVARTGTHLFEFIEAVDGLRGWGRSLRDGIGNWYTSKTPEFLAYQVTKYKQRNGWSHEDVMRLAHPIVTDSKTQAVLRYLRYGVDGQGKQEIKRFVNGGVVTTKYKAIRAKLPDLIYAVEAAKKAKTLRQIVKLIEDNQLVREVIPTQWLNEPSVWAALLEEMPLTAMIRNLGKMTSIGLLKPLCKATRIVVESLMDVDVLKNGRIHPLSILTAMNVYNQGQGEQGKLEWEPTRSVSNALEESFYLSFKGVVPTGKRWMLALDVSGSMTTGEIAGMTGITPRVGSAAMALVTANVETQHHFLAFSRGVTPLDISPKDGMTDVLQKVGTLPFSETDCSLPMQYATMNNLEVDAFVIYTDNETNCGEHPITALKRYRQKTGIPAKLIVAGMTATEFSVADPNDAGMLDVVGWDSSVPAVMSDFVGYTEMVQPVKKRRKKSV